MSNSEDKYWNIFQTILDFVKYSETKAGALITVYGLIISIVFSNAQDLGKLFNHSYLISTLCLLNGAILVVGLYFSFRCINPRLKITDGDSIIYFGNIRSRFGSPAEYYKESKKIITKDGSFERQLAEQIHVNSNIAWKKFSDVAYGMRCFGLNFAISIIVLVIYLLS